MIPEERSHLHVAANSHTGMSGKNNEDRYGVSAYTISKENPTPAVLAVVADGIGGNRAGEVAAEIAVETISKRVAESDAAHPVSTLEQAIIHASQKILAESENNPALQGMGTTCACCWIIGSQLYLAYVGDSRIYRLRDKSINQLSTDHTLVQEAIDAGVLTPEEARNNLNAHVIRRYLGSQKTVVPDTRIKIKSDESDKHAEANQGMTLLPGDQLIMCSDGLTDLVSDSEILSIMKENDQDEALSNLINLANERGGHDNITIVALQMPTDISQVAIKAPAKKRKAIKSTVLLIFVVLILGLVVYTGYYFYNSFIESDSIPTGTPSPVPTHTSSMTGETPQTSLQPSNSITPTNTHLTPTESFTPSSTNSTMTESVYPPPE